MSTMRFDTNTIQKAKPLLLLRVVLSTHVLSMPCSVRTMLGSDHLSVACMPSDIVVDSRVRGVDAIHLQVREVPLCRSGSKEEREAR